MLELDALKTALGAASATFSLDLRDTCRSTNSSLLDSAEHGAPSGSVLIARQQTEGRGRRGRTWVAAPGDSLTFSLLWRFPPQRSPAGLSLAVGLALARALGRPDAAVSAENIRLKWPNDVLCGGRKLAGVLVELVPGDIHAAVIGIGLNLKLPAGMPEELRQTAAALPVDVDANSVLAHVLVELAIVCRQFATGGFAVMRQEWVEHHAYQDYAVVLTSEFHPPQHGVCRGVDSDGALLFERDGEITPILSGEISLRPLPLGAAS